MAEHSTWQCSLYPWYHTRVTNAIYVAPSEDGLAIVIGLLRIAVVQQRISGPAAPIICLGTNASTSGGEGWNSCRAVGPPGWFAPTALAST